MPEQSLDQALTLRPADDGGLSADLHGDFSNGPLNAPPERGFPFGGLIAALCASAMRQGLEIAAPLRSLSVQYMSPARFGQPITLRPRLLRGGRSASFAQVDVIQLDKDGQPRLTNHAAATFGDDVPGLSMSPLTAPPPLEALKTGRDLQGPLAPRFSQHVDYRFDADGPWILRPRPGHPVVERCWMRIRDAGPLDAVGLCYLMDALYPPVWTMLDKPVGMATVDLRYDILADPTPERCPDGWAFSEFRMLDFGAGWTVDEATVWAADGAPLAIARQRRKLAPVRPARG